MSSPSRRAVLLGSASVAAAAVSTGLWNLHQHIPSRDPLAEQHFAQAQARLLHENGKSIHSRFAELRTPNLHAQILEGGQGEPVVFLHGGAGIAAQWEPLLSHLSSDFHVFAPDRPGCGLTQMISYTNVPLRQHAVDFVRSTFDALHLPSANLVGNSMGSYFSLVFALAYPERVRRLVLVGEPAGSSATISGANRLLAIRGLNGLLYSTVMRPGSSATREGFKRILVAHPERLSQTYLDCCTAASLIPGATESWLTLLEDTHASSGHSTLTYTLRPELSTLQPPTLMLWGDRDTFGPPALAQEMAALMPHAQAVTLPDAGHLAWLDQPTLVETRMREFLRA